MSRYEGICFLSKCLIFWQLTKFDYLMPLWGISFPCLSFDILYYWKIECLVKPNFHFGTCVYNTFIYFPKRTNRMSNTSTVKLKKTHQVTFFITFFRRQLPQISEEMKSILKTYRKNIWYSNFYRIFFNSFQRTRTMTKCLRRETTRIPLNWTFLRTCRPHFRNTTGWATWSTTVMWR